MSVVLLMLLLLGTELFVEREIVLNQIEMKKNKILEERRYLRIVVKLHRSSVEIELDRKKKSNKSINSNEHVDHIRMVSDHRNIVSFVPLVRQIR